MHTEIIHDVGVVRASKDSFQAPFDCSLFHNRSNNNIQHSVKKDLFCMVTFLRVNVKLVLILLSFNPSPNTCVGRDEGLTLLTFLQLLISCIFPFIYFTKLHLCPLAFVRTQRAYYVLINLLTCVIISLTLLNNSKNVRKNALKSELIPAFPLI